MGSWKLCCGQWGGGFGLLFSDLCQKQVIHHMRWERILEKGIWKDVRVKERMWKLNCCGSYRIGSNSKEKEFQNKRIYSISLKFHFIIWSMFGKRRENGKQQFILNCLLLGSCNTMKQKLYVETERLKFKMSVTFIRHWQINTFQLSFLLCRVCLMMLNFKLQHKLNDIIVKTSSITLALIKYSKWVYLSD